MKNFQEATLHSAAQIMASMGVREPGELRPAMLRRRLGPHLVRSYAELYEWLGHRELLADPPEAWADAHPDRFSV